MLTAGAKGIKNIEINNMCLDECKTKYKLSFYAKKWFASPRKSSIPNDNEPEPKNRNISLAISKYEKPLPNNDNISDNEDIDV